MDLFLLSRMPIRRFFDGTSSGLRISKAKVAVLFDPVDKGFALIGSGNMKSYASGMDLEGAFRLNGTKLVKLLIT